MNKLFLTLSIVITSLILAGLLIFDKPSSTEDLASLVTMNTSLTTMNDSLTTENQRLDSLYHITLKNLTSLEEYTNVLESDIKSLKAKLVKCNNANNLLELTQPTITDIRKRVEVTLIDSLILRDSIVYDTNFIFIEQIVYDTVFLRPFDPFDPHNPLDSLDSLK